jgi:predicted small integral membrane protein
MTLEWMSWTGPTAWFFCGIAALLVCMTAWQLASPSVPRRGLLPLTTTRGDRLFIGLLGAAFIHLAWIGLASGSLWYGSAIAVVWMIALMRFG